MKQNKFRIWDKQFENWVSSKDARINPYNGECHGRLSNGNVKEWELMQFTGRCDKNTKEIYNGDIVIARYYPFFGDALADELQPSQYKQLNYVGIVAYDDDDAAYYLKMKVVSNRVAGNVIDGYLFEFDDLEIIGNIYQNPELLEVKNDDFKRV